MMFNWQQRGWPKATVNKAALRDELDAFKIALRDAKRFLGKPQEPEAVARALAQEAVKTSAIEGVILRMFEDGRDGIRAGLSAAKWVRMTKVAKRTAERDLADLAAVGAIIPVNGGPQTRYQLNIATIDGAIDTINDTINTLPDDDATPLDEGVKKRLLRLVALHPGRNVPFFKAALTVSRITVARAVAALVAAGKIEHRGSKKTGGYYAKEAK